jgi:hypothetical protein
LYRLRANFARNRYKRRASQAFGSPAGARRRGAAGAAAGHRGASARGRARATRSTTATRPTAARRRPAVEPRRATGIDVHADPGLAEAQAPNEA